MSGPLHERSGYARCAGCYSIVPVTYTDTGRAPRFGCADPDCNGTATLVEERRWLLHCELNELPYRAPDAMVVRRLRRRPRFWRRLACWLLAVVTLGWRGHRWRVTRADGLKLAALAHLNPLAGCDAICVRCDADRRDAWTTEAPR